MLTLHGLLIFHNRKNTTEVKGWGGGGTITCGSVFVHMSSFKGVHLDE